MKDQRHMEELRPDDMNDLAEEERRRQKRRKILRRLLYASAAAGAVAAPALLKRKALSDYRRLAKIHRDTDPGFTARQLERELRKHDYLPRSKVIADDANLLQRILFRFRRGIPIKAGRSGLNAATIARWPVGDPQSGLDHPWIESETTHPKVLMHELGHAKDYMDGTYLRKNVLPPHSPFREAVLSIFRPSKTRTLQAEIRAWDNAKVDKSDPLRRTALQTYVNGARYGVAQAMKRPVAFGSAALLAKDIAKDIRGRRRKAVSEDGEADDKGSAAEPGADVSAPEDEEERGA